MFGSSSLGCWAWRCRFVPSFTYVASAEAPAHWEQRLFVDVDMQMPTSEASLRRAVSEAREAGLRPAVVVAIDLFGLPVDLHGVELVARSNEMKVLVDAAQSFGGNRGGRKVGTMGDATTTSFPSKTIGLLW